MEARVHDEIVVDAVHVGDATRKGEILEIIERGGVTRYRVRWDDGQESVFFPASTTHVVHTAKRS